MLLQLKVIIVLNNIINLAVMMKMIDEKRCLDSQRKCLTVKIDHYDANYQDARFAFVSKYGFIYS